MPINIYQTVWIILIYSFLGWCAEVAFAAVKQGKFVNRGFLNGPVCPIYGFGMLSVVTILWGVRDNIVLLFVGAVVFTSVIEFITGFLLEQLFHDKWWDYSDMKFNIKGYVCLRFSLLWGVAASFIVGVVHPLIYKLIVKFPFKLGVVLVCVLSGILIVDFVITFIEVLKLPKRMRALIDAEKALNAVSVKIGENISEGAIAVKNKDAELNERLKEKQESLHEELERKKEEYAKLIGKKNIIHSRIVGAFPNLKRGRYEDVYKRIADYRAQKNKKNKK